jgi:hypothetical protein
MSNNIAWAIPFVIKEDSDYTRIRIYRGSDENDLNSYSQINEIDREDSNGNEILSYTDSDGLASPNHFYFIKYYSPSTGKLSRMGIAIFELTPKEQRLVDSLKQMLDPIITSKFNDDGSFEALSDTDLILGIRIAMSWFNSFSPVTYFNMATFPSTYEGVLLYLAQVSTLLNKYVGLSLRDFGYNDNGISLNQNFGPAIQQAISQSMGLVNSLLAIAKMEYAYGGMGVGTVQLPISVGGQLSKGISGILNIFQSSGR